LRPGFVDCHSHVVPSGDDGAQNLVDGIALCELAARTGTEILYATPHVWPHLVLTEEREEAVRHAFEALRADAPLELRLGYELTPAAPLLEEDPARYVLEGTQVVLVEVPFVGPADELWALAEHIEAADLVPLIAHPERTAAVRAGPEAEALAWRLIEDGHAEVVASDGHRLRRPARLDDAYELVGERVGEEAAAPLFDGSALGLRAARPTPSRAGVRDA